MVRPPKKSETIEVRLPLATKRAFMAKCRGEGRTASDAIRAFVGAELAGGVSLPPRRRAHRLFRPVAAIAFVAGIGAAPAIAPAASAPDFRPGFAALDRDRDGAINAAEYGPDRPMRDCGGGASVLALPLERASMAGARGVRPFAVSVTRFTEMDANRDGRISPAEYAAGQLRLYRAGFDALDADRDGRISRAEYAGAFRTIFRGEPPAIASFSELDTDRDGKIAWREFFG